MDLECEGKDGVGLDELRWIHRHKTGALLKVDSSSAFVLVLCFFLLAGFCILGQEPYPYLSPIFFVRVLGAPGQTAPIYGGVGANDDVLKAMPAAARKHMNPCVCMCSLSRRNTQSSQKGTS